MTRVVAALLLLFSATTASLSAAEPTPAEVKKGLREFFRKIANADGTFNAGIDPAYTGLAGAGFSDMSTLSHVVMVHKTFGWQLPFEEKTRQLVINRQRKDGSFFNVRGTADPDTPSARVLNTTQGIVILRAFGVKPKRDPIPVFEEVLHKKYTKLPDFMSSFFPLAYKAAGRPLPAEADTKIRALLEQDKDGYIHNHVAATFHAAHYYRLIGAKTPKAKEMLDRIVRDQKPDGSFMLNLPSRDRHATYDAVFVLHQLGHDRADCKKAIQKAARWALACRNPDGGFGHYPGSTSDVDAIYFHVGVLVIAGYLEPSNPLPADPQFISWGHLMPLDWNRPKR